MRNSIFASSNLFFAAVEISEAFLGVIRDVKMSVNTEKVINANITLRSPRGVCEAHLHQGYKLCVIGAIASQTYGNV